MNINTLASAGANIRSENLFDTTQNLGADIKQLAIYAVGVVVVVFVVTTLVKTRGSIGALVGIIAVGAIAIWAATHMDQLSGDVDDTINGSGTSQIVVVHHTSGAPGLSS